MPRKSSYMHFVDNRLRGWPSEWCVAFPVVQTWIHDYAFHRRGGIVAFLSRNTDYPPSDSIARVAGLVQAGQFPDGKLWIAPAQNAR